MSSLNDLLAYYSSQEDDGDEIEENKESVAVSVSLIQKNPDYGTEASLNDMGKSQQEDKEPGRSHPGPLRKYPLLDAMPPLIESSNIETIEVIKNYLSSGQDLTETIRANRQFGNPEVLSKIVKELMIDEIGSNYSKDIFDPHGNSSFDFIENIRERYARSDAVGQQPITVPTATAAAIGNVLPASSGGHELDSGAARAAILARTLAARSASSSSHSYGTTAFEATSALVQATGSAALRPSTPPKKKTRWDSTALPPALPATSNINMAAATFSSNYYPPAK